MITEKDLRKNIAGRMIELRKAAGLTQADVAERINYSDKSVSKWERGDGLPDIRVLVLLAELYGVTVNDFLTETDVKPLQPPILHKQILITMLSMGIVLLSTTVLYVLSKILFPDLENAWYVFIMGVPAASILFTIFSAKWWNKVVQTIAVSCIVWSFAFCFYMFVHIPNISLIFSVASVLQILTILWFVYLTGNNRLRR